MAICKNCGAQIPDGSSFCENCGATQVENNQVSNRQAGTGKKKIPAKWIGIAAAVVVAVIAIVMISSYVQHGINIGNYIEVKYTGGNGHGTANVGINYDKLTTAVYAKEKGKASPQKILAFAGAMGELEEGIKIDVDKKDNLSNNDKIKVTVTYDKKALKALGIHFTNTSKSFTVSGLKDLISLDPFKDIKVEFKGFADNGTAEIVNNSSDKILTYTSYNLDKEDHLKNGDSVTVKIGLSEAEAESKGYTLTGTSKSYTVSGLKDLTGLDPFQDITVEFKGYAPECTAEIVNNSQNDLLRYASYKMDKKDHLNIGDTVTVTVKVSDSDLAQQGYKLSGTSKTFKLDKADKYITSASEISDTFLESMKKETSDTIEATIAGDWSSSSVLSDLKYCGYYYLTEKKTGGSSDANAIFVVFSGTASSTANNFATQTVYFPVRFTNLVALSSGTQLYDEKSDIVGSHYLLAADGTSQSAFVTQGYTDGTEMFKDLIVKNKEGYNYEMSKEMEQFGK